MTRLRLSGNFVIHAAAIDRQAFNNGEVPTTAHDRREPVDQARSRLRDGLESR